MQLRLQGKRALITGGGSGIGRATAELFSREGAAVMVAGRRKGELKETVRLVAAAGGRAAYVQGDVSALADAERMVQATVNAFGGIDVLVNNAGVIMRNPSVTAVPLDDWPHVLRVDLEGVFLVSRFSALAMVRAGCGGSVVNVSSVSGIASDPRLAPPNAAKGGVYVVNKNMAQDYASHGIRVNVVCLGRIWTRMPMSRLRPDEGPQEVLGRSGQDIPLRRAGTPEDVARAALFLASDEASWVTGAWLVVDGGATVCHPPIG